MLFIKHIARLVFYGFKQIQFAAQFGTTSAAHFLQLALALSRMQVSWQALVAHSAQMAGHVSLLWHAMAHSSVKSVLSTYF
jgi:hypothetical protein